MVLIYQILQQKLINCNSESELKYHIKITRIEFFSNFYIIKTYAKIYERKRNSFQK